MKNIYVIHLREKTKIDSRKKPQYPNPQGYEWWNVYTKTTTTLDRARKYPTYADAKEAADDIITEFPRYTYTILTRSTTI